MQAVQADHGDNKAAIFEAEYGAGSGSGHLTKFGMVPVNQDDDEFDDDDDMEGMEEGQV